MDEMLEFNKEFVRSKGYEQFSANKLPDKKLAVLACMDTRLTELLPAALNFKNGDIKLIKNAGAMVSHPFGGVMRSLLVCIYTLGVEEIAVIGHHDCGMQFLEASLIEQKIIEKGIPEKHLKLMKSMGIDLNKWLHGFDSAEDSVRQSVTMIKNHPLIPENIQVRGFLLNPKTGEIAEVPE